MGLMLVCLFSIVLVTAPTFTLHLMLTSDVTSRCSRAVLLNTL